MLCERATAKGEVREGDCDRGSAKGGLRACRCNLKRFAVGVSRADEWTVKQGKACYACSISRLAGQGRRYVATSIAIATE